MNPQAVPSDFPAQEDSLQALMAKGFEHHRSKRIEEAEQCYREVLRRNPDHAEALHHLGLVRHQQNQPEAAVDLIRKAIALDGTQPRYYFNLRTILNALGRGAEAEEAYRIASGVTHQDAEGCWASAQALIANSQMKEAKHFLRLALLQDPGHIRANYELGVLLGADQQYRQSLEHFDKVLAAQPGHVEALAKRGLARLYLGDLQGARDSVQAALAANPESGDAHQAMGEVYQRTGSFRLAVDHLRRAVGHYPANAQLQLMLASCLAGSGKLGEAEALLRQNLRTHPHRAVVLNNIADVLFRQNRIQEAAATCREALRLNDGIAEIHANLGNALMGLGQTHVAEASYRRALELNPNVPQVHNNLGGLLLRQLRFTEARASFETARKVQPGFIEAHSNILYLTMYEGAVSKEAMYEVHAEFGRAHCDGVPRPAAYPNAPDPQRRLKVGFISADYRQHPVSTFIEAVFKNHAAGAVEYTCYSDVVNPDATTQRLHSQVERWREISGLSHEEVADLVRNDGIDILVDLSSHTANHRLLVFARKPAPVQVSYIGYLNTTGLRMIDYWLTDRLINPPETQPYYTEKLWHLPRCFVCYTPPQPSPDVAPAPSAANSFVTFGIFNNACKVQPPLIDLLCELMRRVPNARMVFKSIQFGDAETQTRFLRHFVSQGLEASRFMLLGPSLPLGYLEDFAKIDIALDTFPNNGNTVTHDSLWMGVPVVTLRGDSCVSRAGLTILSHLGHPEWIAATPAEYVEIAAKLAGDRGHLGALRRSLRRELSGSPLMDASGFARHIEAAWRGMWETWCANKT